VISFDGLKNSKLHFIGVGGSGMSGLARIALNLGIEVSGSDAKDSSGLRDLENLGAKVFVGHKSEQLNGAGVVVVSSAISESNPELVTAKEKGLQILSRAQLLAIYMSAKKGIAVAGTHGKTTTTSMLTVALQSLGLDPSFAIGGTINRGGTNAHSGNGEYFVAEADESDGSLIEYHPAGAIITNIEMDHVDNFPDIDSIMAIFETFVETIKPNGFLVAGVDSPKVRELISRVKRKDLKIITYGKNDADLTYSHASLTKSGSFARLAYLGKVLGELELSVPGEHNIENACSVVGVGLAIDLPITQLMGGLKNFTGARRRFEVKGEVNGVTVVDDYGHHPTEIEVTLAAARNYVKSGKLYVIFQPHRYSRTLAFTEDFAKSLTAADTAYILEIYSAGEKPLPGVTSANIAKLTPNSIYNPSMVEVVEEVSRIAKSGDLIMTLGAGDVSALGPVILESLNAR
jgi:UDP-N-acetylmuramate--alanine ligase